MNNDDDRDCWVWNHSVKHWIKSTVKQTKSQQISYVFVRPEAEITFVDRQPQVVYVDNQPQFIHVLNEQAPIVVDLTQPVRSTFFLKTHASAVEALPATTTAAMTMGMTTSDQTTTTAGAFAPVTTGTTMGTTPVIPSTTLGGLDIPMTTGTGTNAQQVAPANAGSGVAAADAAVGSFLSLTALALVTMFGSRWLTAKKR